MSQTSSDLHALARTPSAASDYPLAPAAPLAVEPPNEDASGRSIGATLKRRWVLILSTWAIIAGALGVFIWTHFGIEYEAVGFVRVAPSIRPVLFRDEESGLLPFYNAFVAAQMQNITNPRVLKAAVESPEVRNLPWVKRTDDPVKYLAEKLEIENPEASELIAVSLLGPDPSELAPTVNAVLHAYHEKVMADNQNDDTVQLKALYDEQAKLERELKSEHGALYSLANEVGTLSLGDQQGAAVAGVQQVQIELKKAQTRRVAAAAHYQALEQRGPTPLSPTELEALRQDVLMADPELASLNMARHFEEDRLLRMSQQLGPDHRELKSTRERSEHLRSRMAERAGLVSKSVDSLAEARARAAYETELKQGEQALREATQAETALQAVVQDDLAQLASMGKNAVQLQALREKADLTKQLHNQVLQRIGQLEVEKQRPARITIDTLAGEPTSPAKDKRPKLTILALVAGLFTALILGVTLDARDTCVRCEDDVRRRVGLSVLGTRTIPKPQHVSNKDIVAAVAEEMRGIRGCVLFAGDRTAFKTLLITSPNPREGKTRTAGDLAVALAESGRRVLLIDADNRKRDLTRQLGAENRPGLSDLLANGHRPEDFILTTSTAGLSFLPAGPLSEDFSEHLVRPGRLEQICRAFEAHDLVLVDSPPVLLSNDACEWARVTDSILLVLRAKHSAREDALAAKEKLNRMGGRIMGAVLNGVQPNATYYNRYAYGTS